MKYRDVNETVNTKYLEGKTIKEVIRSEDEGYYGECIKFRFTDGEEVVMYHKKDCCEQVTLEDVAGGELSDLVGELVVSANEVSNEGNVESGSCTWTFYIIRTNKVTLTLRWLGTSNNGYYSEDVDLALTRKLVKEE